MANALAIQNDINLDDLQRTARMLVASGYFDAKGAPEVQIAQLATKIMAGRELGYGPFASVQGIHVIQGKLQVAANLMAAAVKSHPRYDYKVRKMEADDVIIEFFENGESIGKSQFTREDATKAGTQNLNKFPRNMLFARALSNGVRWFCPDVFHGQSVYVEGELEDTGNDTPAIVVVDRETGEIVEGEYTTMQALPVTDVTPTNGNGHKPPTEAPADDANRRKPTTPNADADETWPPFHPEGDEPFTKAEGYVFKGKPDALAWGGSRGVFANKHECATSFEKNATGGKTWPENCALWIAHVRTKLMTQGTPADNPFETPEPVTA
jgi:hypothetical protein